MPHPVNKEKDNANLRRPSRFTRHRRDADCDRKYRLLVNRPIGLDRIRLVTYSWG